jgi:hypothetical protein
MSITFKSQATGDLFMLQVHAEALLKLLGKTPGPQGILEVQDMPAALVTLRALTDEVPQPEPAQEEDGSEPAPRPEPAFVDEPVSLRKRAWPLIQMIERAQAADKPIVWGV